MYQLNEQQVDWVAAQLHQQGLRKQTLKPELLDHFCCFIEEQIENGTTIETAWAQALHEIAPGGFKELEFEHFLFVNYKKQLQMKKLLFFTGFTSAFLISTGIMFKTLHWFPAPILLFLGFAMLLITMILTAIHATRFLRDQPSSFWLRTFAGVTSLALIAIGFMFKTFHMPGANVIYGLGTILLNFLFLPLFFYQMYKNGFVKTTSHETTH